MGILSTYAHLRRALLTTILLVAATLLSQHTQSAPLPEYQVKAALLYKLTKFIQWPEQALSDANMPLGICVFGEDPFGSSLDALADKTVRGSKIIIKRIQQTSQLNGCHVLFVSTSEKQNMVSILHTINNLPILAVSDIDRFAQQGGIINLVTINNKIHFEINIQAAKQAQLKISAQLLELATIIHGN